jgi:hypothetical protein
MKSTVPDGPLLRGPNRGRGWLRMRRFLYILGVLAAAVQAVARIIELLRR